jgi:hypothetical protein
MSPLHATLQKKLAGENGKIGRDADSWPHSASNQGASLRLQIDKPGFYPLL